MLSFDPYSEEFVANPFPIYQQLQQIGAPYFCEEMSGWLLTTYHDVSTALRSSALSVRRRGAPPYSMVSEVPDHGRLRGTLKDPLSRKSVDLLCPAMEQMIQTLLNELSHQDAPNLYTHFAYPFNMQVASLMLGIDVDRMAWLQSCTTLVSVQMIRGFPPRAFRLQSQKEFQQLVDMLREIIEDHRLHPRGDLVDALLQAEQQGEVQSEQELMGQIAIILLSFRETNANAVGNCLATMLEYSQQLEKLKAHPQLLDSAVDETMRFSAPGQFVSRRTLEPLELSGITIPKGNLVWCGLAAANRDPAVFPNPDIFDITRRASNHLSFATGIHICQGAYLSNMMMRLSLRVLERFPNIRPAHNAQHWTWTGNFMGRFANPIPCLLECA